MRVAAPIGKALWTLCLWAAQAGCGGGGDPYAVQDAAQYGQGKRIAALVSEGADPKAADDAGYTALHVAATVRVGKQLLDLGAAVDARAHDGVTPLLAATVMDRVGLARLLIARGADVEAVGPGGFRPLHHAACSRDTRILKSLLAAGARADARTKVGETPLAIAKRFDNGPAMRLLQPD